MDGSHSKEGVLKQRRIPIHLPVSQNLARPALIFVTICTSKRRKILAHPEMAHLCTTAWKASKGWLVGRYVIMPDHVHFFVSPDVHGEHPLNKWVQFWKSLVSLRAPKAIERPLWQPSFWDRELRWEESYAQKWEYVRNNPVRHALVADATSWPYQGELNLFQW